LLRPAKESEQPTVIRSAAKCVPPDKPATRKTDARAAAAAVFAELINVRAPGAGFVQQHAPQPERPDRLAVGTGAGFGVMPA
jgi:hypothetical protein